MAKFTRNAESEKVVLTGGHAATTAVALVEEIKSQNLNWKLYWIGVRNAIEGKKVVTLESEVLPRLGVKFLPIKTGRFQRNFTLWTIPSILKIPIGFVQSFYHLFNIKPALVFSFGGFAAFPVVISAKILGIPVIIHEQTSECGRSNRLAAKFATKIALSRKTSIKYFPASKCIITGNPVMKEISSVRPKTKVGDPATIFITGGSRGSQSINKVVGEILRKLLGKYKVIHQTGGLDYRKFSEIKQMLPQALRDNYEVFVRINPLEVSEIYRKADVVVSRAGANTVSEIMMVKRPAILIPLPISYLNEQAANATVAKNFGIAKIILQKDLTPETLLENIENIVTNYRSMMEKVKLKESPDKEASKKLLGLIKSYVI